jgi:hypothetical protein
VTAVVGVLVLWVLPALLTRRPSAGLSAAEQLKAANDVRATLVGFVLAVGAAGTLVFTARTFRLNQQGQVTERYTRAVGQIGDASLEVRIGGYLRLERIGRDSPDDRRTVVYVLGRSSETDPGTAETLTSSHPRTCMLRYGSSADSLRRPTWS